MHTCYCEADVAHDRNVISLISACISWGAAIGVEGEEQWGEQKSLGAPVLIVSVLVGIFPRLSCCLLSVRKFVIHWEVEAGTVSLGQFGAEDYWDDCVIVWADTLPVHRSWILVGGQWGGFRGLQGCWWFHVRIRVCKGCDNGLIKTEVKQRHYC